MTLFFFHLRTPDGLERDEDGLQYPDLDVAYLEACKSIPDLLAELLNDRRDAMSCAFEITDVAGVLLLRVPFDETLRRCSGRPSPMFDVVARIERTKRLLGDMRDQHAEVRRQIVSMRDLLSETSRRGG